MEKVINGVSCRVVEKEWDVYFDMALTMFEEIVKNNQAGKPSVFIVPVGPTDQYPILAKLINSQRVSLKNVHFFNMDEYLVSPTQWISEDDPMSFHGRMKREFYDRVDESLVMPESQRHFPEPGHEQEYDRLIADLVIGLSRKIANSGFPLEFHFDLSATPERCVTDAYSAYSKFIEKALREHRCGLITYRYFYYDPQIVKLIEEFQKQGGKMLMINSFGHFPEVPSVCIDDARGGELAARHLLEKNCDHFIYCDPTDEPRSAGFIEALSTAGRRRQLKIFEQRDYTAAVLTYLLSLPRSARPGIFMPSDVDAIRFLSAARERGLEVRKDFLLIGYDGQLLTDMLATPLSTIFQPFLELGEKAAETILQLIEGKSVKNSLIEPYLIERDSSRPL